VEARRHENRFMEGVWYFYDISQNSDMKITKFIDAMEI
jgi:hypothetical protein